MIKQNIKAGLIQGLTILLVLAIGGVSYVVFNGFSGIEATPGTAITATKWNDMVDAVKDEYKTDGSEVRTSKLWDGKTVYRKIFTISGPSTGFSGNTWYYSNNSFDYNSVDEWIGFNFIINNYPGKNHAVAQYNKYNWIGYNDNEGKIAAWFEISINYTRVQVVAEYTKTTDVAE